MKKVMFLFSLLFACLLNAQESVKIRFNQLPPGTTLTDQFASQGVRFAEDARFGRPFTYVSPAFLYPTRDVVAGSYDPIGIKFDQNITSFSIDVSVADIAGPGAGVPVLELIGLEDPSGRTTFSPTWNISQFNKWYRASFTTAVPINLLELQGHVIYKGYAYNSPIYFDNIQFTVIPEIRTSVMLYTGLLLLALFSNWKRFNLVDSTKSS